MPQKKIVPYQDTWLYRIRHSCAHIMAQAVLEMFPEGKLGIGPPIEDGFYYDFDLPRPLTPEDLERIEARMREIIAGNHPFIRREVTPEEARALFKDQPYKLELIEDILQRGTDEYGNPLPPGQRPILTTYRHDTFEDLCRGPHVEHTGQIHPGAFKLLHVAGAYWRGDERRPMLQRIYGTAWETPEQLEQYLWRLEEAKKRDHRRLGRELDLFSFHEIAPGAPFWHPKGMIIFRELERLWREEHDRRGYQEISTPILVHRKLWEQSGHWEHYKENMFLLEVEGQEFSLKPMNCPESTIIYRSRLRSYRDLPLRLNEIGRLHRFERSGTLHGMLRVRQITMDDAHIYCRPDQILEEIDGVLDLIYSFYRIFDFQPEFFLSTKPPKAMGDPKLWEIAEEALRQALERRGIEYGLKEGEGAFYGPKIDVQVKDAIGRDWQLATVQLDFQMPERFELEYMDRDGTPRRPVMIHRAIFGSFERFIGILTEHYAGAFPVWLAPVQAVVIPITDRHIPYAREIGVKLRAAGLRVEVDDRSERMQAKIRDAQLQKVPYMLIVGDREQAAGTVAVRLRTGEDLGAMSLEAFLNRAMEAVRTRRGL
ncbi:Threonine--tRNA ligase 2 [Candidatus Thermoflexus japonica]|uniref:Threonine--tRNA ligase n=1 Tax=Candidatus Thermoflexus japonica TaxID=2035417 RepID=A0A2H5Y8S1_9CHLR|nr:Threonine--tRNA ligase 2 [Candidatus Thermoflexus japonica]